MALSRRFLSAMGIEEAKIDEIVAAHTDTVDALKEERESARKEAETYKADAEKLLEVQKELDELKEQVETDAKNREGKDYDELKKQFDEYKEEQERKATRAKKEDAYKAILKDAGIPEKHYAKILKYSDIDSIELDDDGKAKDAKNILKVVKEEWDDHIEKETILGAPTENPPAGKGGGGKTKEEILAIKDRNERQRAISENHELFGY